MSVVEHPPVRQPALRQGGALSAPGAARLLSRRLQAGPTATRVLEAWCLERGLGAGPIRAVRQAVAQPPRMEDAMLDLLAVGPGEVVRHRRVVLMRGGVGLSDCDLWWLPGRLPGAVVEELDATDHPFGLVVAALAPRRRTVFESVLPEGDDHLLEHRAVVVCGLGMRQAVAGVREMYRRMLTGLADGQGG